MALPTCYPRTTLKKYVAGWIDDQESSTIEAHLSECLACEQTIADLEKEPDTLLDFMAESVPSATENQEADAIVNYALAKAKQLNDEQFETPMDAEVSPSMRPTELGPYDIMQPIGQGSMGRVYLGKHRQLGKLVAIKVFAARAFRSPQYAARFEREVRAAGALQHPAIINATDAGQVGDVHYLVMEYIDGMDLSRLVRTIGRLSIGDACAIAQSIALGLDHAHAAGVVHRDIKPSNIMLSMTGQVKLLDFGLAQTTMWDEASAELTTVGQLMGTIDYMAPEQAERAESVDYRADLYALGATLFRLLCGRAPLAASPDLSPLARLRLLATATPPALRTLRPDAPVELERLIGELLSRNPEHRPASAAHVAQQLSGLTSSSDLTSLIRAAQQAIETQSEHSHASAIANTSLAILGRAAIVPPRRRIGRWLMAAAAAAASLAAIVFIVLETQKGQVVIESMDANVVVELSKDGRVHQSVAIVPGANTTRIAAGQYAVSIAAGSDRFELDQDSLEIKRGQTVVARVRPLPKNVAPSLANSEAPAKILQPAPTASMRSAASTENGQSSEKLFDGKTLKEWRTQLERERSSDAIKAALEAINALAAVPQRKEIVLEFLPNFPGHFSLPIKYEVFTFLSSVAGDMPTFLECVVAALPKADDGVASDMITYCNSKLEVFPRDIELLKHAAPLTKWCENLLQSETKGANEYSPARKRVITLAATEIMIYLNELAQSQPAQREREQQLSEALRGSKVLDDDFWLSIFPAKIKRPVSAAVAKTVEERATEIFINGRDPQLVSAATLVLIHLNDGSYDRSERTGMPALQKRTEIVKAIGAKLLHLAEHPDQIPESIELRLARSLIRPALPSRLSPRLYLGDLSRNFQPNGITNPCFDLLQLATVLNAGDELQPEMAKLLEALKGPAAQFAARLVLQKGSVQIMWPHAIVNNITSDNRLVVGRPEIPEPSMEATLSAILFTLLEPMLSREKKAELAAQMPDAIKAAWIVLHMQAIDEDKDGQLSSAEMQEVKVNRNSQNFYMAIIDENDDKSVSRDELRKYYESKVP